MNRRSPDGASATSGAALSDIPAFRSRSMRATRLRRGIEMNRRGFIGFIGGAAVWPLTARAQEREPLRRLGMLLTVQEGDPATQERLASFERRLGELGWNQGRNIRFEPRWAGGDPERLRANVAEMVRLAPDVILAQNTPMVAALRKQTDSIPIVFVQVSDPVGDG